MVIARNMLQGRVIVDCLWCLLCVDCWRHHLNASKEGTDRHGTVHEEEPKVEKEYDRGALRFLFHPPHHVVSLCSES